MNGGNGHGAEPPPKAMMQIVLRADGALQINFPSLPDGRPDEVLCFFLLERGRMLVEDKIRAGVQPAPRIIPGGVIPPLPRGLA